ncbi:hypothetical protein BDY21DRAFT_318282 [Lineolata rhizophorae]|uniref:FAD synthase n=1 Tax=Lineolata rhizophorae TaxID=578093 RepID=A0A6A6P5I8_9PEZI|nr:hypothetical protein BDY21DRAFT_318282 [Lineolata rhizophorae]
MPDSRAGCSSGASADSASCNDHDRYDSSAAVATSAAAAAAVAPPSPLVPNAPLPLPDICARLHQHVSDFLAEADASDRLKRVRHQTRVSLGVIEQALDKYTLPELSLSYNGGKDCLVLLVLYLSALHSKGVLASPATSRQPIQCVYIQAPDPFPEVENFVKSSAQAYSLSLATYAKSMKAAFADYLADKPRVKAIFVGTRRTDPHGEFLTHFDPTDHGWPDFMRIHPVIDWHYVEIWTFIRHLRIPYCSLYDRGYTSLGGMSDTHPNPALRRVTVSSRDNLEDSTAGGNPSYRPAYELIEDLEERLGRDK